MRQEIKDEVAKRLRPRDHINKTLDTLFKFSNIIREKEEQKSMEQEDSKPVLP